MKLSKILATCIGAATLVACSGIAQAQFSKPGTAGTAQRRGLFHRPMFGSHATGAPQMGVGSIIGNRNTHVYHMPGDKGQLPDPKNRVYFSTAAQARAAGYRPEGGRMAAPTRTMPMRDPKTGRFMKGGGRMMGGAIHR